MSFKVILILITLQIWTIFTSSSKMNVEMTKTTSSRQAKKSLVPVSRVSRLKFAEPTISTLPIQPITPDDKYNNKLSYGRVSAGCRILILILTKV